MSKKEFGKAHYKAFRNGNVVKIIATGTAPGMNVKVDIEQLPFLIYPPMFGLYFIIPEIVLPALRPFTYEEDVFFPKDAEIITILDADGQSYLNIEDGKSPIAQMATPAPTDNGYCVFSWIGMNMLNIAKCDAVVPAVYSRVFGPSTYGECEKYTKDNSGH